MLNCLESKYLDKPLELPKYKSVLYSNLLFPHHFRGAEQLRTHSSSDPAVLYPIIV